jgi:peptidoglycan/LPS O-acetylase OafA/YrhL
MREVLTTGNAAVAPAAQARADHEFRRDIQSLRGFAVVIVLLYHFQVPGFGNGFVGVDVFFVISGYLITQLIVRSRYPGFAGFWHFTIGRVRRLYPALIALVAGCLVLGFLVLPTEMLATLGRQSAAALLFLSNLVFWQEAGYFNAAAHSKFMLHTWSLGVEGQFYVLFAGFMFLIGARLGARALTVVLALCLIVSLAVSVVWTSRNPVAAFYLLPARIFEFAIGALIANKSIATPVSPALQALVRYLGLAMLLSIFAVEIPRGQFPGYWAALPVLGTGLVILAGEAGQRPRFLQMPPGVFLGDISYSLYLWHWPVYVCFRTLGYESNTVAGWIGLFAISMVFGTLSYRFVELPFRKNRTFWTPRRLVAGVGASLCALMMIVGVSL